MLAKNFFRYYPAAAQVAGEIEVLAKLRRLLRQKPERKVVGLPSLQEIFRLVSPGYGRHFSVDGDVVYECWREKIPSELGNDWFPSSIRETWTWIDRKEVLGAATVSEYQVKCQVRLQEEADKHYRTTLQQWEEQIAPVINWSDDDWAMEAQEKFDRGNGTPVLVSIRDFRMFADLVREPLRIVAPELLAWLQAQINQVWEYAESVGKGRSAKHLNLNLSMLLASEEGDWIRSVEREIDQLTP